MTSREPRGRLARRRFLAGIPAAAGALAATAAAPQQPDAGRIGANHLECMEAVAGLDFTDADRKAAIAGANRNLGSFEELRKASIPGDAEAPLVFRPYLPGKRPPAGATPNARLRYSRVPAPRRSSVDDLAFLPVTALAPLVEKRDVSSTELTRMYLARLKAHGPALNCVVTLTEELALAQAARADKEIRSGRYRGALHGIPWGAKDLLATRGIPTTWGAAPFERQVFDYDATVVERLQDAGAVLVAKLSLGALAQGDNWFRGQTRTPWNRERGSSGSSAGPGAATAAGLVGFSIGSETRGSIISPSAVNGVAGLRPTYGRVSRHGAMTLSWTMDKIGPMCRAVEDCALVLNAIYGPDGRDESVVDTPFRWAGAAPLARLRIAYVGSEFEAPPEGRGRGDAPATSGAGRGGERGGAGRGPSAEQQRAQAGARLKILNAALDVFRQQGATLHRIEVAATQLGNTIGFILAVEAAAAFDDLTRSDAIRDPSLNTWPNTFRTHRYVPAVEYLRAQRARTVLIREMDALMSQYDVILSPTNSSTLGLTNLTGHPALALRAGFIADDMPVELMITGRLYDEATVLGAGLAYERATTWHERRPGLGEGSVAGSR